jgi:hypothetical protein
MNRYWRQKRMAASYATARAASSGEAPGRGAGRALLTGLLLLTAFLLLCDALAATNARVLADNELRIGGILLDRTNRSIRFSAVVNMREETVEYVLVHRTGKTHESILACDTRPQDVHVAMLLLGAQPVTTNQFGPDNRAQPQGSAVVIEAAWTNAGQRVVRRAEELVWDKNKQAALSTGPWIYNGSHFGEGAFVAQRDGSIISIHIDPGALISNPRPGREDDDLHRPNTSILPPIGTPVEVTIRLQTK